MFIEPKESKLLLNVEKGNTVYEVSGISIAKDKSSIVLLKNRMTPTEITDKNVKFEVSEGSLFYIQSKKDSKFSGYYIVENKRYKRINKIEAFNTVVKYLSNQLNQEEKNKGNKKSVKQQDKRQVDIEK